MAADRLPDPAEDWPEGGLPHGEHPHDYGYGAEQNVTEGMSPELVRALRDPTIRVPQDDYKLADGRQIAQLTERVELLEVLGEQAVGTIEFLHGCLTEPHEDGKPGGFTYAYPEQTERRLAELRRFLPEREVCVHSKFVPGCQGCIDGEHAREVMGRAVLADKDAE